MNPDEVLQHIDPETIARDTLDFVQVKSETGDEGAGSAFLAALLRREGFAVEVEEVEPGRPNIYALVEGSGKGGERTLLFNGHTDTIPIGQSAPPERAGDWIIGRGTEDMKGGLVAMVHAAAALRRAGVSLQGNLWLTGVVGHETPAGKKEGPKRLIEHLRSGRMRAQGILIVEGPCAIWAASLGTAIFTVKISTGRGPIHTIKVPYEENPALWAGKLLTEFQHLEQTFDAAPHHPLCGREIINVGMVHGGDYFNRLPTSMTITGSRRWTPGKTLEDVRAQLQEVCDRLATASGLAFEIELQAAREPFETPADHALVRALQAAGREAAGQTPELIGMGLAGDANLYFNEGDVTTVYYGPAHETAHSDHERVAISQLAHCARIYALAAINFCGVVR